MRDPSADRVSERVIYEVTSSFSDGEVSASFLASSKLCDGSESSVAYAAGWER